MGLTEAIESALAHDRQTLELEDRWSGRKNWLVQHGPEAQELDRQLDAALSGIISFLDSQARLYGAEDPRAEQSEDLRQALFPAGLARVSQGSYVAEFQRIGALLRRSREAANARAISALGLSEAFERLGELTERYRASILANEPLSFEQLRSAREDGEENLAGVVVRVLALFPGRSREHRQARAELLAPLEAQEMRLAAVHRQRRKGSPGDEAPFSELPAAESETV